MRSDFYLITGSICIHILSTCYNHFISIGGVGKERGILIGLW